MTNSATRRAIILEETMCIRAMYLKYTVRRVMYLKGTTRRVMYLKEKTRAVFLFEITRRAMYLKKKTTCNKTQDKTLSK